MKLGQVAASSERKRTMLRSLRFSRKQEEHDPLTREDYSIPQNDDARTESLAHLDRIGVLWSADGIQGPVDPFNSSGAQVATAEWTRAMACHGHVENLDIYAPMADLEACRRY